MSHAPENAPTEKLDDVKPETVSLHAGPAQDATLDLPASEPAPNAATIGLAGEASIALEKYPPSYAVVRELGRGGMGVVYQARQVHANRMVALKMILSGGHASETDRIRFQMEAEAVARLSHANIVQVYEVGEHAGNPYFSLEYCAGGTLAEKLQGKPLPPLEAARLVQQLARGMAMAHSTGVVHRDLKPANILFTEGGVAKITDFGLAKRLDDDSAQTRSGSILGTPSYMAPEQAQGNTRQVGPAADIYALGAILYECLTGKPPFRGDSIMATLQMVRDREPAPPSQSVHSLPRDLETICLKCLRKEPAQRYSSSAELADDLERFLQGEPIQARRVGALERATLWVRRNKLVAGLIAAVILASLTGTAVSTRLAWTNRDLAKDWQDAAGLATKNEKIAQAETLRAQANEKALAAALADVETTLVKGFTQSIGFGDTLTDGDKVAIMHLQRLKNDEVRQRFLREMLAAGADRFVTHKEILAQVIVGVDPKARAKAVEILKESMSARDPNIRYASVALAAELYWKDETFSRQSIDALSDTMAYWNKTRGKTTRWNPRVFDMADLFVEHAGAPEDARARTVAKEMNAFFVSIPDSLGKGFRPSLKLYPWLDDAERQTAWLHEFDRLVFKAPGVLPVDSIHTMTDLLGLPVKDAGLSARKFALAGWCNKFTFAAFVNEYPPLNYEDAQRCMSRLPKWELESALLRFIDEKAETSSFDLSDRRYALVKRIAQHKAHFPRQECTALLLRVFDKSLGKGLMTGNRQNAKLAGMLNVLLKGTEPIPEEEIRTRLKWLADRVPKTKSAVPANDDAEAMWLLADLLSEKDRQAAALRLVEHFRNVETRALYSADRNAPLEIAILLAADKKNEPIGEWLAEATSHFLQQYKLSAEGDREYTAGTITPGSVLRRLMQLIPDQHLEKPRQKVRADLERAKTFHAAYVAADFLMILDRTQPKGEQLSNARLALERFAENSQGPLLQQFLVLPHGESLQTALERVPPEEASRFANSQAERIFKQFRTIKTAPGFSTGAYACLARFDKYLDESSRKELVSGLAHSIILDSRHVPGILGTEKEKLFELVDRTVFARFPQLEPEARRTLALDLLNLAIVKSPAKQLVTERLLEMALQSIDPSDLHDLLVNPYTPQIMRQRVLGEVARRANRAIEHQWDAAIWLQKNMAQTDNSRAKN